MVKTNSVLITRFLLSPLPCRLIVLLALLVLQAAVFILASVPDLVAAGFTMGLVYGVGFSGIITGFFMLISSLTLQWIIAKARKQGQFIIGSEGLLRISKQIRIVQQQPFLFFFLLTMLSVLISMLNAFFLFQVIGLHIVSGILPLLVLSQMITGSASALILLLFSATLAWGMHYTLSSMTDNLLKESVVTKEIKLREQSCKYSAINSFAANASPPILACAHSGAPPICE